MGSIISKIADEIELHGSYEEYCTWRDRHEIPYFPNPEVVGESSLPFDNGLKLDGFIIDEFPDAGFREKVLPAWYYLLTEKFKK